jgi:3-mercaptopyruvate sulfurtransferase SseA
VSRIDSTISTADNGWRMTHEARGGHIPGAVAFASAWRASEAWFNAYLMGWSRISVYAGGW